MVKKYFLFFLGIVCSLSMQAQNIGLSDSLQVHQWHSLASQYLTTNPEKALKYADSALVVQTPAVYGYNRGRSLELLGQAHLHLGNQNAALKNLIRSKRAYGHMERKDHEYRVTMALGKLYEHDLELNNKALEYYIDAANLISKADDPRRIIAIKKVAELYETVSNLSNAIFYRQELLSYYKETDNSEAWVQENFKIGQLHEENEDFNLAISYYVSNITYCKQESRDACILEANYHIANAYRKGSNFEQAINYYLEYLTYKNALKLQGDTDFYDDKYIKALTQLGEMHIEFAENSGRNIFYEEGRKFFEIALRINQQHEDSSQVARLFHKIGYTYEKTGDSRMAIDYYEASLAHHTGETLETQSANYLHLARIYHELNKHRQAFNYYENYSETNAQIIEEKIQHKNQLIYDKSITNNKQHILNRAEQMILDEEMTDMELNQLQLQAEQREKEIELLRKEKSIQELAYENELLEKARIMNELALVRERYEAERRENRIKKLEQDQRIQELALKESLLEKNKQARELQLAEQENELQNLELEKAALQKRIYIVLIVLISALLSIILIGYFMSRKANRKLALQKEKIGLQSEKLQRSFDNLAMLNEIGQDIISSLDIETIVYTTYERVNTLMDASVLGIGIYNSDRKSLEFPAVIENGDKLPTTEHYLHENNKLSVRCFETQKVMFIRDFFKEAEQVIGSDRGISKKDCRSIIYVPLINKGKSLGVLTVQSFLPGAYSNYHLNLVRNMANYITIALENAHAYQKIADKSRILQKANHSIKKQKHLIEDKNKALTELNIEKNHIISIIAHDLRNPLALSLRLNEFIQKEGTQLSKDQEESLQIMQRSLRRMDDMIRKILDVRAIESNNDNAVMEAVHLPAMLSDVRESLSTYANQKKITIYEDYQASLSPVIVDRNFAVQIFENLISNAIKFSYPEQQIWIRVTQPNGRVRVEVKDEGQGISLDDMPRLFRKFQRLSSKPTAGENSIGLGLSIVKKYVEQLGGKVWCESEPGQGTSFFIELKTEDKETFV